MVKIKAIRAFRPANPESFSIPPYDVISKEMENELKKNPESSIHVILPNGDGEGVYKNAEIEMKKLIDNKTIIQEEKASIYFYRQESFPFTQEGFILGVSIEDYENGLIKKHEHTREKPLKDRTKHITSTKMNTGLVWTTYKRDDRYASTIHTIKSRKPVADFDKYDYRNILWQIDDLEIIEELKVLFSDISLYIADGHHRAASGAAYRKNQMEITGGNTTGNENWNNLLIYAASDDQVRILPYNRVIKKLNIDKKEFLGKIMKNFGMEILSEPFVPKSEHNIGMFYDGQWYNLLPKKTDFGTLEKNLDVSIVQELLIDPILGIKDIRNNNNIFFVGGVTDPKEMEKYVTEKGNAIFLSLYPVKMTQIEGVADNNNVMPPKSTWFDPKLLSGLIFNPLFD